MYYRRILTDRSRDFGIDYDNLMRKLQENQNEYNMLSLVKDIRDGKVLLSDSKTGKPVYINWINPSAVDDEGDAIVQPFLRYPSRTRGVVPVLRESYGN